VAVVALLGGGTAVRQPQTAVPAVGVAGLPGGVDPATVPTLGAPTLPAPSAVAPGLRRAPHTAAPRATAPHSPPFVSTIGELANASGQDAYLGDTSRYQWVVLQEGEYADIPAIKAANPGTRVLAYEDAAVTEGPASCQDDAHPAAGVSYCQAAAAHPEWFLTGSGGNRLTYCDFPSEYAMDIGNPAYQAAWRDNVAAVLRHDGWDGVFIDDVNTHPGHCLDGRVAAYSDAQYGAAMAGFVRAVAPALRGEGLATAGNVAADPWTSWQESTAEQIAASVGSFFREFWQRWQSGGVFTGAQWSALMAQADRVQAAGAAYLANTYGSMSETAVMAYARASWLLAWNGSSGASAWDAGDAVPYSAAWATGVGTPLGRRHAVGAGWRRDFTAGVALVDPSPSAAQTFILAGRYTTSTGVAVSGSITLQPGTAAVLVPA